MDMEYEAISAEITAICNKERLEPQDLVQLQKHLVSADAEIRQLLAEQLAIVNPKDAWPILQSLSYDSDPLVRTEACQALGGIYHSDSLNILLERAQKDSDELVRAYAIMSLGEVLKYQEIQTQQEVVQTLESLCQKEESEHIRLAACTTLYQVNPKQVYLDAIFNSLKSPEYFIRCSAINQLSEIISSGNQVAIKGEIAQLKRTEETRAVQSTIECFEQRIHGTISHG